MCGRVMGLFSSGGRARSRLAPPSSPGQHDVGMPGRLCRFSQRRCGQVSRTATVRPLTRRHVAVRSCFGHSRQGSFNHSPLLPIGSYQWGSRIHRFTAQASICGMSLRGRDMIQLGVVLKHRARIDARLVTKHFACDGVRLRGRCKHKKHGST